MLRGEGGWAWLDEGRSLEEEEEGEERGLKLRR